MMKNLVEKKHKDLLVPLTFSLTENKFKGYTWELPLQKCSSN